VTSNDLSRRTVLGVLGGGAATTVLAGCGGGDGGSSGGGGGGSADAAPTPDKGVALVATAKVPVGSGVILTDQKVVVTQPQEGTFRCFTAVCTHQGCTVGKVSGDQIECPCHGSVFSAEDGSVINGPAQDALAAIKVKVKGDEVVKA
jgi:nitrite reductase/ring-hydroxylating ferredoxin subunit